MMKYLICLIVLLTCGFSFGQPPKLKTTALNTAELENKTYLGFDGLGNSYFIKSNVFIKQSETQTWEYKNVALGKITSVDLINPLKLVLFYEDFNAIITLDNQLNEIQKLNLFEIDAAIFASKIGLAAQNQFWIYNALNQQILLFNYLKNSFTTLGNPVKDDIKFTQTDFNYFYWVDEINNWYSCDIFGKVTLLANIPPFDFLQIIDSEKLLFSKGHKLYLLNNKTKAITEIEIVEKSFQNFYYKDQILAIFTNLQISNYKITIP